MGVVVAGAYALYEVGGEVVGLSKRDRYELELGVLTAAPGAVAGAGTWW